VIVFFTLLAAALARAATPTLRRPAALASITAGGALPCPPPRAIEAHAAHEGEGGARRC
jgi:hypothetical protein